MRRLALRPRFNSGEHHAPHYREPLSQTDAKAAERLRNREYDVIDLDTGEVLDRVEI